MAHPSDLPTKRDVVFAAWQATIDGKLDSIQMEVGEVKERLRQGDPVAVNNTQRLDGLRKWGIALVGAFLTALVVFATTCVSHTERDAETRVSVVQHEKQIEVLQKAVSDVNNARANDAKRITDAIDGLRDAHIVSESGVDCAQLTPAKRHRLRALVGNPFLCNEEE